MTTTFRTNQSHVSCELGGETVIMDMGSGKYYGLDPIATTIWAFLQQPRTITELLEHLLAKYDVSADRCSDDVAAHLTELQRLGLIEVQT